MKENDQYFDRASHRKRQFIGMRRAARQGIKRAKARRAEHRKQARSDAERKADQTFITLVLEKGLAKRLQSDPAKRLKFLVRARENEC
jgi:hypothetical protein